MHFTEPNFMEVKSPSCMVYRLRLRPLSSHVQAKLCCVLTQRALVVDFLLCVSPRDFLDYLLKHFRFLLECFGFLPQIMLWSDTESTSCGFLGFLFCVQLCFPSGNETDSPLFCRNLLSSLGAAGL